MREATAVLVEANGRVYVVEGRGILRRCAVSRLLSRLVTMKELRRVLGAVALACFTVAANGRALGYGSPAEIIKPYKREALQDIVSKGKGLAE